MKIGDLVIAETISEGSVERRVVEIKGDTVYICTEKEWRSAREQHREPICVGFNKRYIRRAVTGRSYHASVSNA